MGSKLVAPNAVTSRDTEVYELIVGAVFGVGFDTVYQEARRTGLCHLTDLHQMGRRILFDLVRLARGEISTISIPRRLPYSGEYTYLDT